MRILSTAVLAGLALPAAAADFGTLTVKEKPLALTSACAVMPRYDMLGWGKPEVTLLLSDQALDCPAVTGWMNAQSGAFEQAVRKGRGALLSVSFKPGLALERVSVMGVGYVLGNSDCEGCQVQAAYAGAGFKGTAKTTQPLMLSDIPITFDVHFDLPKPAAPAAGQALAKGGEPGQAYLAYLKAHQDGDYAALQKLMPEGEAEDDWGYYEDAAERRKAIQDEDKPKTAKILEGWGFGDTAILVVEVPWGGDSSKAVVGLAKEGGSWRVREERMDFGGTILGR